MDIKILPFEAQYFRDLFRLETMCYRKEIAQTPQELKNVISYPNNVTFLIFFKDEVIGAFILNIDYKYKSLIIVSLTIYKQYRKQGIGKQAILFIKKMAAYLQFNKIQLQVEASNEEAISFFKIQNFSIMNTYNDFLLIDNKGYEMLYNFQ